MSKKCETVIISDKAYNAMIRESFAKHPVETGGILLGHILEGGLWVVMEMVPPGFKSTHQSAYFEYDLDFVNYLGTSIANQYKEPLQVLGLWHRHPGSMDYFSSTDDGTNSEFASKNPYGVISGLVNIDPSFRLTMYHLDHNNGVRPRNVAYSKVDVEVGDDLIPERFFDLRYVDSERSELHPTPTHTNTQVSQTRSIPRSQRNGWDEISEESRLADNMEKFEDNSAMVNNTQFPKTTSKNATQKQHFRKWVLPVGVMLIFIIGIFVGVKFAPLPKYSNEVGVQETTAPPNSNGEAVAPQTDTPTEPSENGVLGSKQQVSDATGNDNLGNEESSGETCPKKSQKKTGNNNGSN